jgi:hypothetical protein
MSHPTMNTTAVAGPLSPAALVIEGTVDLPKTSVRAARWRMLISGTASRLGGDSRRRFEPYRGHVTELMWCLSFDFALVRG